MTVQGRPCRPERGPRGVTFQGYDIVSRFQVFFPTVLGYFTQRELCAGDLHPESLEDSRCTALEPGFIRGHEVDRGSWKL